MEAAAAVRPAVSDPQEIAAAAAAFAALSPFPLESCGSSQFPSVHAPPVAAQGDEASAVAELQDGAAAAAAAWRRRLELLYRRERLRMHLNSLDKCFSPFHKLLHVVASGAAALSATCEAAAQQLQQALTQRQPVLGALQLLRDRRLLLQERQRLCGLLLEQLRLSSPLLQAITHVEAADSEDSTRGEKRVFFMCDRFFDALEELQRIREHAAQLQRVVAAPPAPAAAVACTQTKEKAAAEDGRTMSPPASARSSLHNSSLRRRALAEAVLQQAGELQELAYERLYLWLQQECRAASVVSEAANEEEEEEAANVGGAQAAANGIFSQYSHSSSPLLSSVSLENQQSSAHRYKPAHRRTDNSSSSSPPPTTTTAETAAAATRIACFFAALGASGVVAASAGACPPVMPAAEEEAAAAASAARRGAGEALLTKRATATEGHEELLGRQGLQGAAAAVAAAAALSQKPPPLLLRACLTLQDRPAYLSHCLQELLQVRRKIVAEEFYRLLFASSSTLPRKYRWLCSSSSRDNSGAAAACEKKGDRGDEGSVSKSGDGDMEEHCFNWRRRRSSSNSSTRLVCLKRSHPLIFLQGLLHCVTAVAARERAVVRGLQQLLLLPAAARYCGAEAASPSSFEAAEGTAAAAAEFAASPAAKQHDLPHPAETAGGLQVANGVEEKLSERDLPQNEAAEDISGISEVDFFSYKAAQKKEEAAAGWQTAAESSVRGSSSDAAALMTGDETRQGDASHALMCSADILEWLLSGVAQLFEKQMEEVFAAVQQQASFGGGVSASGERQQQRPAYTLVPLVMAHLLDRQAVFLRRLMFFFSSSSRSQVCAAGGEQQRRAAAGCEAAVSTDCLGGAIETAAVPVAVAAAGDQHLSLYHFCTAFLPSLESQSGVGAYKKTSEKKGLPRLIACCETYAEKAELLFISLWEQQLMAAASSGAGASAAYSTSAADSSLLGSKKVSTRCGSSAADPHLHACEELCFSIAATTRVSARADPQESEAVEAREAPHVVDLKAHGSLFLHVTTCLWQVLEILHAPLSGGPEEQEATAALSCFIGADSAEDCYCRVAARPREAVLQGREMRRHETNTASGSASRIRVDKPASGVLGRAGVESTAGGEAVAMPLRRSSVETLVYLFEPLAAVCRTAPGRRSKITGLRITDRLRPLQKNESEELDGWVESSVAPLLNFCRQEAQRLSDPGDAAVFLINAYASIEAPLLRFAVCRVYSELLEELLEQQFKLLHQVETSALLSRLGLQETLDAVRREVQRRRAEGAQQTAVAGKEGEEERAVNGVLRHGVRDTKTPNNFIRGLEKRQLWESRLETWDTSDDDIQVGGALSPAECCLQQEALSTLFRKFSFILYSLRSFELRYVGRLIQEKHQLESRRAVMREVVAAYTEIYVRTKHLGVAVHTPGEVALLVAA